MIVRNIIILLLTAISACAVSCSRSGHIRQILSDAERIVAISPDSALVMVNGIEMSDLSDNDSKALYTLVVASAHKANESPMAADSLTRFAFDYYRDNDIVRFLKSGDLYALHRFWSGDGETALALLDSLAAIADIPDSLRIELLSTRIGIGGAMFDCERNISYIKRLQELDKDSVAQIDYKYQLCENYQFAGRNDSALVLIDELIDYAKINNLQGDHFKYAYEKIGILEESGRYSESNETVDYILAHAPHNSAIPYLHYWKALNYFNIGNFKESQRQLAIADSCAAGHDDVDKNYYESFAGHLREFLAYKQSGIIKLSQLATLNNSQRDRFNRIESNRWQSEQNALKAENRALDLKSQNERKTAIIIIVILIAVIISIVAAWNIQKRKRRVIEAEERVDALNKMVDELKQPAPTSGQDALRRAMLQQLGIIKMVAETPTEQNREMLRKISSIESETDRSLVNWTNLYEIIDNLYSGFHKRLHERYAGMLTEKEEQVIVLFIAGFSAKEISVITSQSTASIYVRKSSVKKKLNVPEKEDVMAFLRQELSV